MFAKEGKEQEKIKSFYESQIEDLYAEIGWLPGKMFYEIIWDMEAKGWIEGQWDGPKRHHRNYFLTEAGVRLYSKVEEESLHSVQIVQTFLNSVLELMK